MNHKQELLTSLRVFIPSILEALFGVMRAPIYIRRNPIGVPFRGALKGTLKGTLKRFAGFRVQEIRF